MITIEVRGQQALENRLRILARALDPVPILDQSAAILLARIRKRFLEETDPDGIKWQPSKAAQRRAATNRGGGTLFDTGKLFRSIQLYAPTEPNSRTIGSDVEYGVYHQIGLGQIRRSFLGFNDEDADIVTRFLIQRINRALQS